ncbi:MAG: MCE family protein, partial [Actinobacteria bacterium]|nr:MCE family protein [Actinomycetota bacterium]
MKPMRERNQVTVAIVGTALLAVLLLLAVNLNSLPFVNPTHTYYADFLDANGLKSGDDVRVEGVSVGSVESVGVQGDHVRVAFTVTSSLRLGDQSRASIEIATVLGNLFMQVESAGSGRLASGQTIPTSRTTVPYTLLGALNTLGTFAQDTDLPNLRKSLQLLAQNISGISPQQAGSALTGLASLAQTVAQKQAEI